MPSKPWTEQRRIAFAHAQQRKKRLTAVAKMAATNLKLYGNRSGQRPSKIEKPKHRMLTEAEAYELAQAREAMNNWLMTNLLGQ